MDQEQSITNPIREKGKHLTFENCVVIQTRLRDKWSIHRIARMTPPLWGNIFLGCVVNYTVYYTLPLSGFLFQS